MILGWINRATRPTTGASAGMPSSMRIFLAVQIIRFETDCVESVRNDLGEMSGYPNSIHETLHLRASC